MTIVEIRRKKLQHLIDTRFKGSQAAFVEKTEINQGELSGLLRQKSFGEKKARKIELLLGLPPGYLDTSGTDDKIDPIKKEILSIYDALDETLKQHLLEQARSTLKINPDN